MITFVAWWIIERHRIEIWKARRQVLYETEVNAKLFDYDANSVSIIDDISAETVEQIMLAQASCTNARSHHDTHAIPPQFVQDAYLHYNKIKISDLDQDNNVIDFRRGLTTSQQAVMMSVGTIKAAVVQAACSSLLNTQKHTTADIQESPLPMNDIVIYEHENFPGLQITPGILSPEAQIMFVSRILHDHLADSKHKINLQTDYKIDYHQGPNQENGLESNLSLFTYAPTDICSRPKDPRAQPSLNMVQLLSKKFRWLTIGEQYDWPTRSYQQDGPTSFPTDIAQLVSRLFPHIRAESGVCLLYGSKDYMPVHRDVSEQCHTALASFSFGCDGIFLVARGEEDTDDAEEKKRRTVAIRVRSGDCVHMTGECRWAWHAMPRTISGTCPEHLAKWPVGTPGASRVEAKAYEKWKGFMASKRLNVSCRQVWDR